MQAMFCVVGECLSQPQDSHNRPLNRGCHLMENKVAPLWLKWLTVKWM